MILQLLKLSIERLTQAGYVYIGMDHFALPEDELVQAQRNGTLQRNFQGYSTHGEADILAFGMSAISQVPDAYWQNQKELSAYQNRIDAGQPAYLRGYLLSKEDQLRRAVIMQIMCNLGVDYQRIEQDWGIRFSEHFARELEALRELEQDGLVRLQPNRLVVTDIGRLLVRVVAMTFDTYLASGPAPRHAMTV